MAKQNVVVEGRALTEQEKALTLEERDAIIVDEIKGLGFISNRRLAKDTDVPHHQDIEFEFNNGSIKFLDLPKKADSLYFMTKTKDRPDIYTEDPSLMLSLYPDREVIKIDTPKTGCEYDLDRLSHTPGVMGFSGRGRICYTNTISSPKRFRAIRGSIIDIVLLRDGYIRIDLINTSCETLSFLPSKHFENALDIHLDSDPKFGGIFLTGVKNGLVIYHPVLAQALKLQSEIGVIDRNEGLFYAHTPFFYCPEEFGECFVDMMRTQGRSSIKDNIELLSTNM